MINKNRCSLAELTYLPSPNACSHLWFPGSVLTHAMNDISQGILAVRSISWWHVLKVLTVFFPIWFPYILATPLLLTTPIKSYVPLRVITLSLSFPAFSLFPDATLFYRTLSFQGETRSWSLSSASHRPRPPSWAQRLPESAPAKLMAMICQCPASWVSVHLDTSRLVERRMAPQHTRLQLFSG